MATPALVVVVTVALLTLVVLATAMLLLVRQLTTLSTRLRTVRDQLDPALASLTESTAVTQSELERVSDATTRLHRPDHPY